MSLRLMFAIGLMVLTNCCHALAQQPLDDEKPTLGLSLIDSRDAQKLWKKSGLPMRLAPKKGLMISDVKIGSEAQKAGVQQYDLLEKVGKNPVRTVKEINELVVDKKPGDLVDIQIRRLNDGVWVPIKGSMRCGSLRTNYYSQMKVSGSVTTGSMQVSHVWFEGDKDYVAPVMAISPDKEISLMLEISDVSSEALYPHQMQMRAGDKLVDLPLKLFGGDTDILTDPVRVHQWQRMSIKPDHDVIALLRSSKPKVYRLDGRSTYSESAMDEVDQSALDVFFAVYDDMIATGNRDMTLGGRVGGVK